VIGSALATLDLILEKLDVVLSYFVNEAASTFRPSRAR
jgi:hypothetical protein